MAVNTARDIRGKASSGTPHDRQQVLSDAVSQRFQQQRQANGPRQMQFGVKMLW